MDNMCQSCLQRLVLLLIVFITINAAHVSQAQEPWPNNKQIAISLSYDDALHSQLDNALPALNQRGLKASFYVSPLSDAFSTRVDEWKEVAVQGHELGNHTLVHACKKSLANRDWVPKHNDLDIRYVQEMVEEVTLANTLLYAMDAQTIRTFTAPCNDKLTKNGNYIEAVKDQFIGIKGSEDPNFARLIAPNNISAQQIIAYIEKQPKNIKLINVLFHGIGGDHLAITTAEHNKLLDYLQANKDKYWVDTYRNIMQAIPQN